MSSLHQTYADLRECVKAGDHLRTADLTLELVKAGQRPTVILEDGLLPAMEVVGKRFKEGEIFLPEVLVCARAMKAAMAILQPMLEETHFKAKGRILLATVKGDVHDIGKNLVGIMLRGAGFEVIDIGTGCTAEKIIQAARDHRPDIIGLSALLTTTMTYMQVVVDALKAAGETMPIIVGGAPVNGVFASEIRADGTARTAAEAVELVRRLLAEKKQHDDS